MTFTVADMHKVVRLYQDAHIVLQELSSLSSGELRGLATAIQHELRVRTGLEKVTALTILLLERLSAAKVQMEKEDG
jgi:hypothetical protein